MTGLCFFIDSSKNHDVLLVVSSAEALTCPRRKADVKYLKAASGQMNWDN